MSNLCTDIILGQNWQEQHESVTLCFGGAAPPVSICGLSTLHVEPPTLFQFLASECKPIARNREDIAWKIKDLLPLKLMNYLKKG